MFCKILLKDDLTPYFEKAVIIDEQGTVKLFLFNSIQVNIEKLELTSNIILDLHEVEDIILKFSKATICTGTFIPSELLKYKPNTAWHIGNDEKFHHSKCLLISLPSSFHDNSLNTPSQTTKCKFCFSILDSIKKRKKKETNTRKCKRICIKTTPNKHIKLKLLRKNIKNIRQIKQRTKTQLQKLKLQVQNYQKEFENLDGSVLIKNVESKIPQNQILIIKEMFASSNRKNPKGNHYTKDWIMLCMLLHIRSPAGYAFLKNNQLLPLPCARTIRKYLAQIPTTCGFDKCFFELFKKHLSAKNNFQKHGLLIFDEISLRESISVNSKTLSYTGLIDFGKDSEELDNLPTAVDINSKATHGLVFLFQPLADSYTQPIGVFASRGPVNGLTLVKLIIKAVLLLEKSGAYVHGFVSDGAQTNRRVWTELGISGKLNSSTFYTEHFVDENRKFFAFSDTPHLIKCVRNGLYNNKKLKVPMPK